MWNPADFERPIARNGNAYVLFCFTEEPVDVGREQINGHAPSYLQVTIWDSILAWLDKLG